jgi:hypothetical protein
MAKNRKEKKRIYEFSPFFKLQTLTGKGTLITMSKTSSSDASPFTVRRPPEGPSTRDRIQDPMKDLIQTQSKNGKQTHNRDDSLSLTDAKPKLGVCTRSTPPLVPVEGDSGIRGI